MISPQNTPQARREESNPLDQDPVARLILPVGRSGWAIAAGYLGLLSLALIPAPFAVIVSVVAIRDIWISRNTPHPKHGMGRAIFGLLAGLLACFLLLLIFGAQML